MLSFFPTPYPDECWYSILCRYHVRSGNVFVQKTFEELFRKKNHASISSIFPNNTIYDVSQQLPSSVFNVKDIIINHTAFSYFSRMYSLEKKYKLLQDIINGNATPLFNATKFEQGKHKLKYCPICCEEDEEKYGENYWHLQHQLPLTDICLKHKCYLKSYLYRYKDELNYDFLLLDKLLDKEITYAVNDWRLEIAKMVYEYQHMPLDVGPTNGYNNLTAKLINLGYSSKKRKTNQSLNPVKIHSDLIKYFGDKLVKQYFGDITQHYVLLRIHNWRLTSPERYILLAVMIGQTAQETFQKEQIENETQKKILLLKNTGICYSKKYIADQLGIKVYQLDTVIQELGISPFWKQEKNIINVKTEIIKTSVTIEDKKEIDQFVKELGYANRAEFIYNCIKKEMNKIKV